MKLPFSLKLAPLALVVVSFTASLETVVADDFNGPIESYCVESDIPSTGEKCDKVLNCVFNESKLLCYCDGSTWECSSTRAPTTSPPTMRPTSAKPTCDGTAQGCAIGEAYFVPIGTKEDGGTDVDALDLSSAPGTKTGTATAAVAKAAASAIFAAGAAEALL
jgi:hypothetical protein